MLHDKPHFRSIHAKFGLATLVLGFLAPLGGFVSFRRFGLLQRFPDQLQMRIKWFHRNVSIRFACSNAESQAGLSLPQSLAVHGRPEVPNSRT